MEGGTMKALAETGSPSNKHITVIDPSTNPDYSPAG